MILLMLKTLASKILNWAKAHWKQLLLVLLGVFLTLKMQSCVGCRKPNGTPVSGPSTPVVSPLPKNDKERVIVNGNQVIVQTPTDVKVVTGTRGAVVEVTKDNKIIVKEKTHGFVLNPLIGFGGNNTGMKGVVGAEVYYYKKLDLIGGMGADKYLEHTSVFVALGYTPQTKILHNTILWGGPSIDLAGVRGIMVGVAVRI